MSLPTRTSRSAAPACAAGATALLALSACTSNVHRQPPTTAAGGGTSEAEAGSNDEAGDDRRHRLLRPRRRPRLDGRDHRRRQDRPPSSTTTSTCSVAEGTNDVNLQISQVETFINDGVDAIVLLPFDGAAMTPVALKAMEAGIPVINVDREFNDPNAARVTVLGDNYGMGVSAGHYICEQVGDNADAVVAEIAGIDSLPLTQDRSQGFEDALAECGLDVDNRVAADFTVEGGEKAAANLLQAAPKIDAVWNHDDDQGVGVLAAIDNAGRDEFIMVGGAGSANAMRDDPGRRQRPQGHRHLPLDPGRRRRQAGPPAGPGARRWATSSRSRCRARSSSTRRSSPQDNVDEFLGSAFES